MALREKFSLDDHGRMLRLQEEIQGRVVEMTLIIDRNLGSDWPKQKGEFHRPLDADFKNFRGPVTIIGRRVYTSWDNKLMVQDLDTGGCVIYDFGAQICTPC